MAKTKGSQKKLRDAVVGLAGTCSSTEPPPKRIRTKTNDSQEPAVPEMPKQSTVASEVKEHGGDPKKPPSRYPARHTPVSTGPPTASWDNFQAIQNHYRLSDEETTAVLLDVLGPDPRGSGFWREYQRRVKEELVNVKSEVPKDETMTSKVTGRAPAVMLHDNQLGDPDLCPEYENGKTDDDFDEDFEEEPTDDDDDDEYDGEEVEFAESRGG